MQIHGNVQAQRCFTVILLTFLHQHPPCRGTTTCGIETHVIVTSPHPAPDKVWSVLLKFSLKLYLLPPPPRSHPLFHALHALLIDATDNMTILQTSCIYSRRLKYCIPGSTTCRDTNNGGSGSQLSHSPQPQIRCGGSS